MSDDARTRAANANARDDPDVVLGLARGASADEIRQAYFRLVREHSPEAHPEEFKRIRAAYEALRSPTRRAEVELFSFDGSVATFDLDLLAEPEAGDAPADLAAALLAVELSLSDLARTDFAEDQTELAALLPAGLLDGTRPDEGRVHETSERGSEKDEG